ncbi:9110_t:CDS:1, partial [Cetraspora pellucida]
ITVYNIDFDIAYKKCVSITINDVAYIVDKAQKHNIEIGVHY